ncbi:MAG TPA: zinc-binding dehydrogenase [Hyphomicrobiaceae bacterium]|nr:zinc-binding dehydrogenase [Hyphomicrobiaceae bacterium]
MADGPGDPSADRNTRAGTAMRAVAVVAPDVLRAEVRPLPTLRPGEVLVRVAAAGVNRHDIGQRKRGAAPAGARSDLPGLEVAGEVVESLSAAVPVGSRIAALVDGGGYAEYCAADAGLCFALPAGMAATEAAAWPEALLTAWYSAVELGQLPSGGTLLILGAAGGVGIAAIQMALIRGANVVAAASTAAKREALAALGAAVSGYRDDELSEAVGAASGGRGADVVLDLTGTDRAASNLGLVACSGRIVHMASGELPAIALPLRGLMAKSACITGGLLRPLPLAQKRHLASRVRAELWPHVGTKLRAVIDRIFPLEEAVQAHRRIESRAAVGKVVLSLDQTSPQ